MTNETLEKATVLQTRAEAHEDFISNCDYFIRNLEPTMVPVVDRWLERAIIDEVLLVAELKTVFTDLRDVVTSRLSDIDKALEAL